MLKRRTVVSFSLAVALGSAGFLPGQGPPDGFGKPDQVIRVGVLPGRLRFDQELLQVAAGSKVQLIFHNNDAMQHNLLICRRGRKTANTVGMLAARLGAKAPDVHFVPDSPDVLFHTKAILPGQTDTIWFVAPERSGDYPYVCTLPGHMFTMRGILRVGAGERRAAFGGWSFAVYNGKWQKLPDFAKLEPVRSGTASLLQLASFAERKEFGLVAKGVLDLPAKAKVRFFLNSDDGSRLLVDGRPVVVYDGLHPAARERVGELDLAAGKRQLRLEYFQGGGGRDLRLAMQIPGQARVRLAGGKPRSRPRGIPIAVTDQPVVMRVHVEQAAARSIAVGLPHGVNYVFDAGACQVQFFWSGGYLDVGPDRNGRGGRPCKILGVRFDVGAVGFPLRDPETKAKDAGVRFSGYRVDGTPTFLLDWQGQPVRWSVTGAVAGLGLRYQFELPGRAEPVEFRIDPAGLELSASAGTWRDGVLTVPAAAAARFSVTLVPTSPAAKSKEGR